MVNHQGALRRNVLWLLSTLTVVVLLFGYHTSTEGEAGAGVAIVGAPATQPSASSSSVTSSQASTQASAEPSTQASAEPSTQASAEPSSQAAQPTQSAASGSTATAATSTVTGDVAQTQWGPVQVRLTMSGSTIKSVDVIEYPNGNGRDYQINAYAIPRLVQETLNAQSAQIDMISGATVTSGGYLQSLQSALDKA